jgi:hypothetical protein
LQDRAGREDACNQNLSVLEIRNNLG